MAVVAWEGGSHSASRHCNPRDVRLVQSCPFAQVGAHVPASHADGLVDSRAHVQRRRRRVMNTCPRMITWRWCCKGRSNTRPSLSRLVFSGAGGVRVSLPTLLSPPPLPQFGRSRQTDWNRGSTMGKGSVVCGWGCRGSPAHPSVTTSSGCDRQRLATVCCHARCQHSPPVCTAPTGALSVAWCVRGVLPAFPVGTKTSETRAIRIAMYINADVRKMARFCVPTPLSATAAPLPTMSLGAAMFF